MINHTAYNQQINIRNKRESFRKEIRKQIITKRLQQLRKKLIVDKTSPKTQVFLNADQVDFLQQYGQKFRKGFLDSSSPENRQDNEAISNSLQILGKFKKIRLQEMSAGQMRKFRKKMDVVSILLGQINSWIGKQSIKEQIMSKLREQSKIQVELELGGLEQANLKSLEELDRLRAIEWEEKSSPSKMRLLKQVCELIFLQKIEMLLDFLDDYSKKEAPEVYQFPLIPIGVIKWLYFSSDNMNIYFSFRENIYKKSQPNSFIDQSEAFFCQEYFQISRKVINYLSLTEICLIFFNSIENVTILQDATNQEASLNLNLFGQFISSSPFEHLIGGRSEAGILLKEVERVLRIRIEQKEVWLLSQYVRRHLIFRQEETNLRKLQEEEVEVAKGKALLEILERGLAKEEGEAIHKYQSYS